MGAAPLELAEDATCFHDVPPGPVNEVAARLVRRRRRPRPGRARRRPGDRRREGDRRGPGRPGGGAADDPLGRRDDPDPPAARGPRGRGRTGSCGPQVVLADPPLMVGLPEERLRASAMNALAHGADSLYTPLANPVSELAALRGAKLIARRSTRRAPNATPRALALGSILCAYALDSALVRPPPRRLPERWSASCGSRTRRPTRRCCRARARDAALALPARR